MNFGENLQILRKKKNYSQEDLADLLQVSRQAVSKWESGTGYPETEKIISICEIFGCSMDDLVKGNVSLETNLNKKKYDSFMNSFSKSIALAISLLLVGVTILLIMLGFLSEQNKIFGILILFIFICIAVPIFVIKGLEMDHFKRKYKELPLFYTEEEIDLFESKFARLIALGVSIILIGLIVFMGCYFLKVFKNEFFSVAIFLSFITISVPIFVYSGIQKSKYDIETYNHLNSKEFQKDVEKIGQISGIIMIITTIVYFIISFVFHLWEYSWIVFPIGGMLCGIVSLIFEKNQS